jgi:hypothetical protein
MSGPPQNGRIREDGLAPGPEIAATYRMRLLCGFAHEVAGRLVIYGALCGQRLYVQY